MTSEQPVVGMYSHHQGSGHLHRCRTIACELAARGAKVTIFSSAIPRTAYDSAPDRRPYEERFIPLDVDRAEDVSTQGPPAEDPTAHGTLHWAPTDHPGYTRRMLALAAWVAENHPEVFYVDVSVEVALFIRLLGIPVVTLAMPGQRVDRTHQMAYKQAAAIIAAWPEDVGVPAHLQEYRNVVSCVGGISRFDTPTRPTAKDTPRDIPARRVVVLQGAGGTQWTEKYWLDVQRACPGWTFNFLGGRVFSDNPLRDMGGADVVVSAAGQNSVADIALTGKPCILIPQDRAFHEQHATASAVARLGLALQCADLPEPHEFPSLLEQAVSMNPEWVLWRVEGAARRAACVILELCSSARLGKENWT